MISLTEALNEARKYATSFYRRVPQQHHDSILSVALEAAWKARDMYNPELDPRNNPRSFVSAQVVMAMIGWWRSEYGRHPKSIRRHLVILSLDAPLEDTPHIFEDDHDELLDLRRAWHILSEREMEVLRDRVYGVPVSETAARFDVSPGRVSQIAGEAVERLRLEMAA